MKLCELLMPRRTLVIARPRSALSPKKGYCAGAECDNFGNRAQTRVFGSSRARHGALVVPFVFLRWEPIS